MTEVCLLTIGRVSAFSDAAPRTTGAAPRLREQGEKTGSAQKTTPRKREGGEGDTMASQASQSATGLGSHVTSEMEIILT